MGVAGRRQDRSWLKRIGTECLWQEASPTTQLTELGELELDDEAEAGFVYEEAKRVHVLFTTDERSKDYDSVAAWEKGECFGTIAAHIPVGFADRIVVKREVRSNLLIKRGASASVELKTPYIQSIRSVKSGSVSYTQGTDYQLVKKANGDCVLEWLEGGKSPAVSDFYAVSLMRWVVWFVGEEPRLRALSNRKRDQLPWKLKLVKDSPEVSKG